MSWSKDRSDDEVERYLFRVPNVRPQHDQERKVSASGFFGAWRYPLKKRDVARPRHWSPNFSLQLVLSLLGESVRHDDETAAEPITGPYPEEEASITPYRQRGHR